MTDYLITKTGFVHYYPEDMDKFVAIRRLIDAGEAVKIDAYQLRSILVLCNADEDTIYQVFKECEEKDKRSYLRRFLPMIDEVMVHNYGYCFYPLDYRNMAEMHEKMMAAYSVEEE